MNRDNLPSEALGRFERPVVCAWCGNRHRTMFPELDRTDLGDSCAANVFFSEKWGWVVNGHYGSGYDCSIYRFLYNEPSAEADPICDQCISERISAGELELVPGNYP